jgi:hypothetical protein
VNKMGESLSRDMVNERISPDYAIWYKNAMANFLSHFRKY